MADYEAYIGYLDGKEKEIEDKKEIIVEVRDLSTFERKVVRAVVARPEGELADSDTLWVTDWVESYEREQWKIRIVEELDEDTDAIRERSDITDADLTKHSEEAKQFSPGRYRGSLYVGDGGEEAKKYFIYKTKMMKDKK